MKYLDTERMGPQAEALSTELEKLVIGQTRAKAAITRAFQLGTTNLTNPRYPIGSFLFLGPTGVGKTLVGEAVGVALWGEVKMNEEPLVTVIECAEFQQSHEINKLVGAAPGMIGHKSTKPLLSQSHIDRSHGSDLKLSIVIFNEFEKADFALQQLMLGVLDNATLTLGDCRKTNFSRTIFIFTCNIGARRYHSYKRSLGFASHLPRENISETHAAVIEDARRFFLPEFLNRITEIIPFDTLNEEETRQIIELELAQASLRIKRRYGIETHLTLEAKKHVLAMATDKAYGARPIKRYIEKTIVERMARIITSGQVNGGEIVIADKVPGLPGFAFSNHAPYFHDPSEQEVERLAGAKRDDFLYQDEPESAMASNAH